MQIFVSEHPSSILQTFADTVLKNCAYEQSTLGVGRFTCEIPSLVQMAQGVLNQRQCRKQEQWSQAVEAQHHTVTTPDGGTVCYTLYEPSFCDDNGNHAVLTPVVPLVFIAPTFTGTADDTVALVDCLWRLCGWIVVIYHKRGVHCPLTSPAYYVCGNDDDMCLVMDIVHRQFARHPILCLGESAGGTSLLRFLGKHQPTYVRGLVTISSAIHTDMYKNVPAWMARILLLPAKKHLADYAAKHTSSMSAEHKCIYAELARTSSVEDFIMLERRLYAPDLKDFLERQSVQTHVGNIRVPTLIINGADDPVCRDPQRYTSLVQQNPNLLYVITNRGSHCAFRSKTQPWSERLNWAQFAGLSFLACVNSKLLHDNACFVVRVATEQQSSLDAS